MNTILMLLLVGQSPSGGLDLVDVSQVSHVEVILHTLFVSAARAMTPERLERSCQIKAEFRGARLQKFIQAMKLDEFVPVSKPEELSPDLRLIVRFYFKDSDRVVTFYGSRYDIYDEHHRVMRDIDRAFMELLWPIGPN